VNCHDASRFVDAYVDGELSAAEAQAVRTHMETCAACDRLATDRRALSRLIQSVPYYEAPPALRGAVVSSIRHRPRFLVPSLAWAAVLFLAVSLGGVTAARTFRQYQATRATASNVLDDHVRALRDQHLIDVESSDQHTVKPWFLGKLDFAPPVDDLSADGFPLVGGRLGRIGDRTVATLVYERRLHPISVFVWPEGDTRTNAITIESIRGFNVRHWTSRGMSFWAVSDLNEPELDHFAALLIGR
jgi:anti-sigma factor RsiW